MMTFLYVLGVSALGVGLVVFSYLDRIYRELGRVTTGPRARASRNIRSGGRASLSASNAPGLLPDFVCSRICGWSWSRRRPRAASSCLFPGTWDALAQALVYVLVEVLLLSQFIPDFLLARTTGRWLIRLALVIRAFLWIVWPFRVLLEVAVSLAHISDEPSLRIVRRTQQEGIEALVDAAEQEGILERDEAQMIEQVVEFSDKRVLEFMTPRPDVVAIPASSTVEAAPQTPDRDEILACSGLRRIAG